MRGPGPARDPRWALIMTLRGLFPARAPPTVGWINYHLKRYELWRSFRNKCLVAHQTSPKARRVSIYTSADVQIYTNCRLLVDLDAIV